MGGLTVKILIAEDVNVSKVLLKTVLKNMGHEVTAASNGQEAWETYQKAHHQVVITDWLMPEMDGIELTRRIRTCWDRQYTYIIVLSMLEGKTNFMEAMDAGADDFMSKPLDNEHLSARLMVAGRFLRLQDELSQLERILNVCNKCKHVLKGVGMWIPLDQYAKDLSAFSKYSGCCPKCSPLRAIA